jgi:predicted GTPase
MQRRRVLILGAAGRDFHDFNVVFRNDASHEVVAFTAAQIPGIDHRRYPPALAGPLYPDGIPIHPERELEALIARERVDEVILAYSDLSHEDVMHLGSRTVAAGADFRLLSAARTMLPARRPVIAVCAVRTGAGKSPVSRYVAQHVRDAGLAAAVVRHPMPYGDLEAQAVQRFACAADLDAAACTIEEREEYEPHLRLGHVVYAGVDYARILERAEAEADVLLWDGGNNDLPFFVPDVHIVLTDPHRVGHERRYHPGEANLRLADIVVLTKTDTAPPGAVEAVRAAVREANPHAAVVESAMPPVVDDPARVRSARVLVIEDGPTLTHGGMAFGAGALAARAAGAAELVDPRPYAAGSLREVYRAYPHIGPVLPAMGYGPEQVEDLARTVRDVPCDVVVIATPADLGHLLAISRPAVRVTYRYADRGSPTLADLLAPVLHRAARPTAGPAPSTAARGE